MSLVGDGFFKCHLIPVHCYCAAPFSNFFTVAKQWKQPAVSSRQGRPLEQRPLDCLAPPGSVLHRLAAEDDAAALRALLGADAALPADVAWCQEVWLGESQWTLFTRDVSFSDMRYRQMIVHIVIYPLQAIRGVFGRR